MAQIGIFTPDSVPVTRLEDWPRPKKDYQWTEGRSAMELARNWLASPPPSAPSEIRRLLDTHDLTRDAVFEVVRAEFLTELPEPGEPRNHDLVAWATAGGRNLTIAVEGKTDEPFDDPIGEHLRAALQRSAATRVPFRSRRLLSCLFGRDCNPADSPYRRLRYQLVMAAAATLIQAYEDESDVAVFVVHELPTWKVRAERAQQNATDFSLFLSELLHLAPADITGGVLYGPIETAAWQGQVRIPLLVGKAVAPPVAEWEWVPNTVSPLLDSILRANER